MGTIIIATIKSWNIARAHRFAAEHADCNITVISDKNDLTFTRLQEINPDYIFFAHWSWIIPKDIYDNFNCVVFHMTDLPFGRGGSPLQNLIVRGIYKTKISAIKVDAGIDSGPIYMKEPLDISEGSAEEIFDRASEIIFEKMIPAFLSGGVKPVPQCGEVVTFARRTPEQSKIPNGLSIRQLYDYIRMLDGEGYPRAFIELEQGKAYFSRAALNGECLTAQVEIGGKTE